MPLGEMLEELTVLQLQRHLLRVIKFVPAQWQCLLALEM
jgi:hypothetical protein